MKRKHVFSLGIIILVLSLGLYTSPILADDPAPDPHGATADQSTEERAASPSDTSSRTSEADEATGLQARYKRLEEHVNSLIELLDKSDHNEYALIEGTETKVTKAELKETLENVKKMLARQKEAADDCESKKDGGVQERALSKKLESVVGALDVIILTQAGNTDGEDDAKETITLDVAKDDAQKTLKEAWIAIHAMLGDKSKTFEMLAEHKDKAEEVITKNKEFVGAMKGIAETFDVDVEVVHSSPNIPGEFEVIIESVVNPREDVCWFGGETEIEFTHIEKTDPERTEVDVERLEKWDPKKGGPIAQVQPQPQPMMEAKPIAPPPGNTEIEAEEMFIPDKRREGPPHEGLGELGGGPHGGGEGGGEQGGGGQMGGGSGGGEQGGGGGGMPMPAVDIGSGRQGPMPFDPMMGMGMGGGFMPGPMPYFGGGEGMWMDEEEEGFCEMCFIVPLPPKAVPLPMLPPPRPGMWPPGMMPPPGMMQRPMPNQMARYNPVTYNVFALRNGQRPGMNQMAGNMGAYQGYNLMSQQPTGWGSGTSLMNNPSSPYGPSTGGTLSPLPNIGNTI